MTVKLLTEHRFEFLSLKGGCTGSSESTLVKMRHCWKSRVTAHVERSGLTVMSAKSDSDVKFCLIKVIRDLESIDHLCSKPIGLIHK